MYKIALVLPYFGPFSNYFPFFLASCAQNKTVDFHVFTDQQLPGAAENIVVHPCTFGQFAEKIGRAFDFPIPHLQRPYNLCDFRPAYGLALQEELKDYDFWGHCDCDLIFGNIRAFFPDELLGQYNRLLRRGHLTLYRNVESVNTFFMRRVAGVPYYKDVYQSSPEKVWCYDEAGGTALQWMKQAPEALYDEIVFDDIGWLRKEFVSSQKANLGLDKGKKFFTFRKSGLELFRQYLDEKTGKVEEEVTCYAHFQKRPFKVNTSDTTEYLIVPNSFEPVREISLSERRKVAGGGLYLYPWKTRWNNLKRKIKNIKG